MSLPAPALRPLPSRSVRGEALSPCTVQKPLAVGELNSGPRLHNCICLFYGRANRLGRLAQRNGPARGQHLVGEYPKVGYMAVGSFLFLKEQLKGIIILGKAFPSRPDCFEQPFAVKTRVRNSV